MMSNRSQANLPPLRCSFNLTSPPPSAARVIQPSTSDTSYVEGCSAIPPQPCPTHSTWSCDLTIADQDSGSGCGPILFSAVDTSQPSYCDRGSTLGSGFDGFFSAHPEESMYLIQNAHDPNDHSW